MAGNFIDSPRAFYGAFSNDYQRVLSGGASNHTFKLLAGKAHLPPRSRSGGCTALDLLPCHLDRCVNGGFNPTRRCSIAASDCYL